MRNCGKECDIHRQKDKNINEFSFEAEKQYKNRFSKIDKGF